MKEDMMGVIKINRKNNNVEVVSKLMDSVCSKYDCSVKYDSENGTVDFQGDEIYKAFIAEETMNLFSKKK